MKKIILVLCVIMSSFIFAGEFDGVWKAADEGTYYFFKIQDDKVNLIMRFDDKTLYEVRAKGQIIDENGEKFVYITHLFRLFDWYETNEEDRTKSLIIASGNKLLIGNLDYEKTDINFVVDHQIDRKKEALGLN